MSEAAASRSELQERQRRWMQQRQAEMDRSQAQESLSAAGGGGGGIEGVGSVSAAGSAAITANNSAVLDRLTEQITERLTVEVRRENARLMQDGAVGAQVESLLEKHIGTNTCPICFELMSGKVHQPTLLFPCGHTFCATCLRMHLEKLNRKTCPYCREHVTSQAPNISLQQVIDGFVERQQALGRGEMLPELVEGQDAVALAQQHHRSSLLQPSALSSYGSGSGGGVAVGLGSEDEAQVYAEQYRAFSMRCRVMANQLSDSRAEGAALRERRRTAGAVLTHLRREEAAAVERLEAQQLELEVIRSQLTEQSDKVGQVEQKQAELQKMVEIVCQTAGSLETERRKALLLVQNFAPTLAEALQREFEEA